MHFLLLIIFYPILKVKKFNEGGFYVKVAFWSNANGPSGVSANLAAISVASAISYPYTITVMENHICSNNLGQSYYSNHNLKYIRERGVYYEGGGIEGLLRKVHRGDFLKEEVSDYRETIINNHLYYIPQSKVIHNNTFSYELYINAQSFFNLLEKTTDIIFIDTAKDNISTKTILEESDLIVVNLIDDPVIHEDFFTHNSFLRDKSIFLVGMTADISGQHRTKLSDKYQIPFERIVEIPYNEFFNRAFHTGRVVEYISTNYQCDKSDDNFPFIQSIRKATKMIIRRTFYLREEKQRKKLEKVCLEK